MVIWGDLVWALGLPRWHNGKESTCQCRRCERHRFSPWVRMTPGVGNGNPLQYCCLENSLDRGAWRAIVHGTSKELHMSEHACRQGDVGLDFCEICLTSR